jgi:hypothetical protein
MDTQTTAPHTSAGRAAAMKDETTAEVGDVASTAGEEAQRVTADASSQLRDLMGQTREDLREQAASQQARAASGLRELSDQLRQMADGSDSDGMARGLVDDVARRAGDAASWLDARDPGSLLDETRRFARRRPGAFLALAAGVGVIAGRLSRGLVDEARDESGPGSAQRSSGYVGTMDGPGRSRVHTAAAPVTSGAVAGAGAAGTAGGMTTGTSGIMPSELGRTSGSGAATTGPPSVPPTPGGSPMASQTGSTHMGTGGLTTEDDDTIVRGER